MNLSRSAVRKKARSILRASGKSLKRLGYRRTFYRFFKNRDLIEASNPNWSCSDRPVAICWRINEWKREYLTSYLPEYEVIFVDFHAPPKLIAKKFGNVLRQRKVTFFVWGGEKDRELESVAKRFKISLCRVEDGFLRSTGPGELHTRPCSLVFDRSGIYFDGTRASDLEHILNAVDLDSDPDLLNKARAGIEIFRAIRLSKYFSLVTEEPAKLDSDGNRITTLFAGQVERDASIRFGRVKALILKKFRNHRLARRITKDFETSKLVYKPHPDTVRKKGAGSRIPAEFQILDPLESLPQILDQVDHVATQTSLVGMEALIHGKQVSTYGFPFYAGWGLTDDKQKSSRRSRKLTLEGLFAGSYLLYPRYIHPASDAECDYFTVAGYFLVEQFKYGPLSNIAHDLADFVTLKQYESFLSAPARLLIYLAQKDPSVAVDPAYVLDLVGPDPKLEDFPQFSQLLITSFNPDILKSYCDLVISKINDCFEGVENNKLLLRNLFSHISLAQRNANGRVFEPLANLSAILIERLNDNPEFLNIIVEYVRVLSNGLQYDIISDLIRNIVSTHGSSYKIFQKINSIIGQSPSRSERHHDERRSLLVRSISAYRQELDISFSSYLDLFVNSALEARSFDDAKGAIVALDRLNSILKEQNKEKNSAELMDFFRKRESHFGIIYDFFLSKGEFSYAKNMQKIFSRALNCRRRKIRDFELQVSFYSAMGAHSKVVVLCSRQFNYLSDSQRSLMQYAKALRGLGELHQAKTILVKHRSKLPTPARRLAVNAEIDRINFVIETSELLASYPQPRVPKGVVLLTSLTCYNTLAMMAPALLVLKRKGYAVVNLMEGMTKHDPSGVEFIDQLAGIIPMKLQNDEIEHEWHIDWQNRRVSAAGINFYQGFYEGLSTQSRQYHIDINEDGIFRNFLTKLKRSDMCLSICEKIFQEVVNRGMPVALVSGNSHVTPFSIFRDFARAKDHPRLSFINCNVAYESYYSNLGSKFATTMAVTDMTLDRDRRAPFFARREDFEVWYHRNRGNPQYKERADAMIRTDRNNAGAADSQLAKMLMEQRSQGRKIVCAFGKVPVDLNVPYDGGPGHSDMEDWLNHTIEAVRGCDDTLLLIKPHPHELRPEIALDLVDGFADLIRQPLPSNVMVLGHKDINVHALAPYLDLAVLWNGSSSLELTALGVPVLMGAYFGKHDYPVDLIYPESREQYACFLKAGEFPQPSAELREKAAFLIAYMGTPEISIRNEFSWRQITNDRVGVPRWRKEELQRLMTEGDEGIELIASRMVEKFEGRKPTLVNPDNVLVPMTSSSNSEMPQLKNGVERVASDEVSYA